VGCRRQVGGRRWAQHERCQRPAQCHVDVREFQVRRMAVRALIQVRGHRLDVPLRQPAPDKGAELGHHRAAVTARHAGQVHLQVRLPQSLACPVGERCDTVGGEAEQRGYLGWPGALDLGVPEHRAPPLRQRREGAHDHRPLKPGHGGVGERDAGVEGFHLAGDHQLAFGAEPVDRRAADRGEQVRPERAVRTAAAPQLGEDLGERLGDHVVGLRPAADKLPGEGACGGQVPLVQARVGVSIACPACGQQLDVTRRHRLRRTWHQRPRFREPTHYSPSSDDF
jgi:hypothetical protein